MEGLRLLAHCHIPWGSAEISDDEPLSTLVREGVYLPYAAGQPWGLFDQAGRVVERAIDFREGIHHPPDQPQSTNIEVDRVRTRAPAGTYIYGGRINPHYGHFLINTLPRFWNITRLRSPSTPILCHGSGSPTNWFSVPFIATMFNLLGLAPSDFVVFDEPVRLHSVFVPGTSLEEQRKGFSAYRQLCLRIGEQIRRGGDIETKSQPVYYSKSRIRSAVGVITNEQEMESVIADAGVKVVYPETMTFQDQVKLMCSHEHLLGTSGSFLHTSIFCPPRRITCLNVTEQINSNYLIIDKLVENDSEYFYPPHLRVLGKHEGFLTARYLPDAPTVARELLTVMQQRQ